MRDVSLGVSSIGVFTIRSHVPIIRECRQIKISGNISANEYGSCGAVKATARKRLLTVVGS